MRLEEQLLVQRRVELRRALVHQQLLRGRLLGQLRQRREQPRQRLHARTAWWLVQHCHTISTLKKSSKSRVCCKFHTANV